jgi:hypothetical protein
MLAGGRSLAIPVVEVRGGTLQKSDDQGNLGP